MIVGGVVGALALLSFLIVALLFYRRLQTRQAKEAESNDPAWNNAEFQGEITKASKEDFIPVELPADGLTAELSCGKHGETTELPNNTYNRQLLR